MQEGSCYERLNDLLWKLEYSWLWKFVVIRSININAFGRAMEESRGIRPGILLESSNDSYRPCYYFDVEQEIGDMLMNSVVESLIYIVESLW